jgi:hypothetical protein
MCAQSISIGGKIGVPFNDPMGAYGESKFYTFGPTVEVRLPAGFAIEGSALYRRLGHTTILNYGPNGTSAIVNRVRGNAWEFPLIGKYYFGDRQWQPFLGTGWALRTVWGHMQGSTTTPNPDGTRTVVPFDAHSRSELGVGATVVAGVRTRLGRLTLLPEIRYTRWGNELPGFAVANRKNEGALYLGIRF